VSGPDIEALLVLRRAKSSGSEAASALRFSGIEGKEKLRNPADHRVYRRTTRVDRSSVRLRIWARIARRPIDTLAIVATCVVIMIIIVNAVFWQSDSSASRRAAGNARQIREFLRVENRDVQRAIGRVKTIFGVNPPR
jgi:hypothetical protein